MTSVVIPVRDRKTMRDFLRLPFDVYRGDPDWVAPISSEVRKTLDVRRNPYFTSSELKLFVCYDGNGPAARVAIVINPLHKQRFGVNAAFFGFFESKNDREAVRRLFEEAESYCRSRGVESLEGPFNPNHYSELGLQANRFDSAPSFFQTHNPPYYLELLQEAGFRETLRFHTQKNEHIKEYMAQRLQKWEGTLVIPGYTTRHFSMKNTRSDLERVREVFNDAFSSNWNFLPLSREEYSFAAEFLHLVTLPELVVIVEHEGVPVGVLECVLDINPLLRQFRGTVGPVKFLRFLRKRKKIRNLIIYAVGIKKAYQGTHVFALLLDAACRMARNFDVLETTWMSDDNKLALRAAKLLGLERDKEFVIYGKTLGSHFRTFSSGVSRHQEPAIAGGL